MAQSIAAENLLTSDASAKIADICRARCIVWLAVFGSVARGDANDESDVDLLVEFEPDAKISYIDLETTADLLSPVFGGRYIDIGVPVSFTGRFAIEFSKKRGSSMPDDSTLLINVLEYARAVRDAMAGLTREEFDSNLLARMGLAHLLQIIGEATRQITEVTRSQYPNIPWKQVVGMRHRLVHEYFRVDFEFIWTTAVRDIPELLRTLEPTVGPMLEQRAKEEGGA